VIYTACFTDHPMSPKLLRLLDQEVKTGESHSWWKCQYEQVIDLGKRAGIWLVNEGTIPRWSIRRAPFGPINIPGVPGCYGYLGTVIHHPMGWPTHGDQRQLHAWYPRPIYAPHWASQRIYLARDVVRFFRDQPGRKCFSCGRLRRGHKWEATEESRPRLKGELQYRPDHKWRFLLIPSPGRPYVERRKLRTDWDRVLCCGNASCLMGLLGRCGNFERERRQWQKQLERLEQGRKHLQDIRAFLIKRPGASQSQQRV